MLRHLGSGVYAITERGEAYLDGELDAEEDAPEEPLDAQEPSSADSEEQTNG